jgi:hypothetical protein
MIGRLRGFVAPRVLATTLVTALTLTLIVGVVVLTTTALGCGPAAKLGLKGISTHCKTVANEVAVTSPIANPTGTSSTPTSLPLPSDEPSPVPSPTPPFGNPVSQAYPPFAAPVSNGTGPAIATVPLTCRLPVYAGTYGSGAFIQFPGGSFAADLSSSVTPPSPGLPPTGPGSGGAGYGLTYDRAVSRWLPVPFKSVSPDGSRYAYTNGDSLYVVTVSDGSQVRLGQGHKWWVLSVGTQGVYATIVEQAGIWLVPFSGDPRQIKDSGFWQAASSGYAYGTATSQLPKGVPNTIIRIDLTTGAVGDWFSQKDATSSVIGFDALGRPLLSLFYFPNNATEIWLAQGPGRSSYPIFGTIPGKYPETYQQGTPFADSHGIWFPATYSTGPYGTSQVGVMLFVPGSGLYWMSSYGVQLAGGCS